MSGRKTVVYVESGMTGGGSFESLLQLVSHLNPDANRAVVVFLNRTRYLEQLRQMGASAYLVKDSVYDRERQKRSTLSARFIERAVISLSLMAPRLSVRWEGIVHRSSISRLQKIFSAEDADIIHTNNQVNRDLYAIIAAQRSGVPCVAHLRSFFSFGFNPTKARFVNRSVAQFLAYSPAVADHWASLGLDASRIEVVYNAVGDVSVTSVDLQAEFGIAPGQSVVGIVGKIIPERGHELLIKALALVVRKLPKVRLLVIGGGEPTRIAALKALGRDLGLGGQIVFAGHRERARDYIAAMDALVLPYSIEPFGRVLLEAWSLGVPTVATEVGGIRSIAGDGAAVLLVPPGDRRALAEAVVRATSDQPLRESLTVAGRKLVFERFPIDRQAAQVQKIYAEVLSEKN